MERAILFSLLKSSIDGTIPSIEMINACADKVLSLAQKHDMAHIIADQLGKYLSDESKAKAIKQKMLAIYRREALDFEEKRISEVFNQNQIAHIPLKGSIIKNYYPEDWMRTSSDIDILVRPEKTEDAVKILCEELEYSYAGKSLHDIQLYSKGGVHIELHFALDGGDDKGSSAANRIWEYANAESGYFRFDLAPEFTVFYNILHAKYHFAAGGCGIKPFLDMYVMNKKLDYNKEILDSLITESGCEKFYAAFIKLTDIWFGGGKRDSLTDKMEEYILSGGVYGTSENLGKASAYRKGGKLKYIFNRIFKPRKELEIQFPNLKNRPILLPYYQIKRWFNLLDKEKRANAETEFSGSRASGQISEMLKDLGI